jgi:hypothetical protein
MKNDYEIRGDITAIFLNRKLETLISTSDLELVNKFPNTWSAQWNPLTKSFYVYGYLPKKDGKRIRLLLHRVLLDNPKNLVVDHIDHDTLNNTKPNLRVATSSENAQNRNGLCSNNKSGVRGVSYSKTAKKWKSTICVNKKVMHIGYFHDKYEAEKAVIKAREEYMPFSEEATNKKEA